MLARLRSELARAGDPKKAAAMQAYMKSAMPYRGVSAADMRAICRRVFAAHRVESVPDGARKWREACL